MIPVEQIRRGHFVRLPNGREMRVARVDRYDADFVVTYQDGPLVKQLRIMRAGDLVDAFEDLSLPVEDDGRWDHDEHEVGRLILVELYRRFGGMPDSEIVERMNERSADRGVPLVPVSEIMRRRRELERRNRVEQNGSRRHPESGAVEPIWQLAEQPTQQTIADEFWPEPDL